MSDLLTVTAAAKRVRRTRRTIETWIAEGLPVIWVSNTRYIQIDQLLAKYREQLQTPKGGKGKPRLRLDK